MKKIIFTLSIIVTFYTANSQIINVCGTDTVVLQLENYLNGTISWQESYDTVTWKTIPNEIGLIYKFHPDEEMFYRAMIKTSECEPLYSPISFVHLTPKANAGTDRVVSCETIHLFGSDTLNAMGEWSLFSGTGTIHEPLNPRSEFSFSIDTSVYLVWTVTNTCGQSSDTLHLQFDTLQANTNFIIVDMTDEILSDSAQMANGYYTIRFSDPEISPSDSVILIGMRQDISFLQRVKSFTYQDSIYYFVTEAGTLEDLFIKGVFNMGDAVNESMIEKDGSMIDGLQGFPTRQTFKSFSDNRGIKLLYTSTVYDDRYPASKNTEFYDASKGFVITLPDVIIFESSGSVLTVSINNSFVSVDPNFVLDLKFGWFGKLKSLCIGVDNAQFQYGYTTRILVADAVSYEHEKTIYEISKDTWFMAGPVPVMVRSKFEIVASFSAGASGSLQFDRSILNTRNFTAIVSGKPGNLHLTTSSSNTKEEDYTIEGEADLSAELKIGPQISFTAYGIVGPYIDVPIKAEASLCAALQNEEFYWQAHAGLGIEGNLGAKAEILGKTLFDFDFTIFDVPLGPQIDIPYELELISGYNQTGYVDEYLDDPIVVRVMSNMGFPVPFVQVNVALGDNNGTTSEAFYWSNAEGLVSIDWQLGSNPVNVIEIFTKDCDFENLEGSPLYVFAWSEEPTFNCLNSDLQIQMVQNGETMITEVTGGEEPYTYSLDGITYSSDAPVFSIYTPGEFTVFVRDANECQVVHSFVIDPFDPCAGSELTVFVHTEANIAELSGSQGVPPYLYALDEPSGFSETDWYGFLDPGMHLAYVKDALDCTDSTFFEISEGVTDPIAAVYPQPNQMYVPVANIPFEWTAGNYAPDQIYDLRLKEDGAGYLLIASDLEDENYNYSGPLNYNSLYYWSVTVKDSAGNPKDTAEFSFTSEIETPTVPQPAELIYPGNGNRVDSISVILKWTDQSGNFVYNVYFDQSDANHLYANNLIDTALTVINLQNEIIYYWKVVTKSLETGLSAESDVYSFRTDTLTTVTDFDGNVYQTIIIGGQKWMMENLKTIHFNDGTLIDKIENDTIWKNSLTPAYCWYNNDSITYAEIYGTLYNWYTVDIFSNGNKNVCPLGWHIPNNGDWNELFNYLGGSDLAGDKMKQTGTLYWNPPNSGATNESGFTALPGGHKYIDNYTTPGFLDVKFSYEGLMFTCWSTDDCGSLNAFGLEILGTLTPAYLQCYDTRDKNNGNSVRCIKDE
jgi:uncharacterized protein (TIGR02145 family)